MYQVLPGSSSHALRLIACCKVSRKDRGFWLKRSTVTLPICLATDTGGLVLRSAPARGESRIPGKGCPLEERTDWNKRVRAGEGLAWEPGRTVYAVLCAHLASPVSSRPRIHLLFRFQKRAGDTRKKNERCSDGKEHKLDGRSRRSRNTASLKGGIFKAHTS